MPNSQISCSYKVTAVGGQSIAILAAALAAVHIDYTAAADTVPGLLPISDGTTTLGQVATRTIVFRIAPQVNAAATATLFKSPGAQAINFITLTNGDANGDWASPPIITFSNPPPGGRIARATANMVSVTAIILNGGSGYIAPTALFVGGQIAPGGRPPKAIVNLVAGAVGGISYTDNGAGLNAFPTIVITDVPGGGSGAVVIGALTVDTLNLLDPGEGYQVAPTISFKSTFVSSNPDTSDQRTAIRAYYKSVIQAGLKSPVTAVEPVVT